MPYSHRPQKVLDHKFALGAGFLSINADELKNEWHTTDYEAGDTLLFHSLTAHKALPNLTKDRMRASLDNRYQALGQPIAEQMLTPHLDNMSAITWEDVYENWVSHELQYYWKETGAYMPVAPIDMQWQDRGFDGAIAAARHGHSSGILQLERMYKIDPTSKYGQMAHKVLAELGENHRLT